MPFDAKSHDEFIQLLTKRGHGHRLIAGTTLAAACVVFIAGVYLTYYWTENPLSGLAEEGKFDNLKIDITPILLVINSLKILSLAAIIIWGISSPLCIDTTFDFLVIMFRVLML
jgi:hypothetical protein